MPRFGEAFENSGVDEKSQWMIVPLKGYNIVLLHDGKDLNVVASGRNVSVKPVNSLDEYIKLVRNLGADEEEVAIGGTTGATAEIVFGVEKTLGTRRRAPFSGRGAGAAAVPSVTKIVKVSGRLYGDVKLHAKNSKGTTVATLDVSVRRKRKVPIACTLVRHKSSIKTARTPADLKDIVRFANDILEPQANVQLVIHNIRLIEVSFDHIVKNISTVIKAPKWETWDDLLTHVDKDVVPSVFFVKVGLKKGDEVFPPERSSAWTDRHILISDSTFTDRLKQLQKGGRTLAHEMLHFLGGELYSDCMTCNDLTGPAGFDIMGGRRIPKEVVDMINK